MVSLQFWFCVRLKHSQSPLGSNIYLTNKQTEDGGHMENYFLYQIFYCWNLNISHCNLKYFLHFPRGWTTGFQLKYCTHYIHCNFPTFFKQPASSLMTATNREKLQINVNLSSTTTCSSPACSCLLSIRNYFITR